MCLAALCFICTLYLMALYGTLWTPNDYYSHRFWQISSCSSFRERMNIICMLIFIRMRSIPQTSWQGPKTIEGDTTCPSRPLARTALAHQPGSKLISSDKAANAGAKRGPESAMQKPFPKLINEVGESGRGQSQQTCPHPHRKKSEARSGRCF